jgi:predicted nuclease of predicted toxin-antitoxin system
MNFVIDENVADQIAVRLRADGHDVESIALVASGVDDRTVLAMAAQSSAIVITDGKGFGDLVIVQRLPTSGVMLLRLEGLPPPDRAELVSGVVQTYGGQLARAFTVVGKRTVRMRKVP